MQLTLNDLRVSNEAAEKVFSNDIPVLLDFKGQEIHSDKTIYSYGKDYFTDDSADEYMDFLIKNNPKEILQNLINYHGVFETLEDLGVEEIKGEI